MAITLEYLVGLHDQSKFLSSRKFPPPSEYLSKFKEEASKNGIPWEFLCGIASAESNFTEKQPNNKSHCGGMMQIMDGNMASYSKGKYNDSDKFIAGPAIEVAAAMCADNKKRYFSDASGIEQLALMASAYNAGPGAGVSRKWRNNGHDFKSAYENCGSKENVEYICRVLQYMTKLTGGNFDTGPSQPETTYSGGGGFTGLGTLQRPYPWESSPDIKIDEQGRLYSRNNFTTGLIRFTVTVNGGPGGPGGDNGGNGVSQPGYVSDAGGNRISISESGGQKATNKDDVYIVVCAKEGHLYVCEGKKVLTCWYCVTSCKGWESSRSYTGSKSSLKWASGTNQNAYSILENGKYIPFYINNAENFSKNKYDYSKHDSDHIPSADAEGHISNNKCILQNFGSNNFAGKTRAEQSQILAYGNWFFRLNINSNKGGSCGIGLHGSGNNPNPSPQYKFDSSGCIRTSNTNNDFVYAEYFHQHLNIYMLQQESDISKLPDNLALVWHPPVVGNSGGADASSASNNLSHDQQAQMAKSLGGDYDYIRSTSDSRLVYVSKEELAAVNARASGCQAGQGGLWIRNVSKQKLLDALKEIHTVMPEYDILITSAWRTSNESNHQRGYAVDINGGSAGNPWFGTRGPKGKIIGHPIPKDFKEPQPGFKPDWPLGKYGLPANGYNRIRCIWSWDHPVVSAMAKHGWGWGGKYGDVMHFSLLGGH